jgi:hypothetical protein
VLERILGRNKNESESGHKKAQEAQKQKKLTSEEQAMIDTLNRHGLDEEKLDAIANAANTRSKEFEKQGMLPAAQVDQFGQGSFGQGSIESIAQGKMPEGLVGSIAGMQPLEAGLVDQKQGMIGEQRVGPIEQQQKPDTQQISSEQQPSGLEKMMTDFKEGLVKNGYSRENAEKLASLYTGDLFSKLAENDQLLSYIGRYEKLPPKTKMEAFMPVFKKAFLSLGISSIIPLISGNLMFMIPGALWASVSLVSGMSQAEKMTFADGIKKNKEKFVKQGVASNVQIDNILGQINEILQRDSAIPPEVMGQAVQEIERQNLILADYLDKNIDSGTKRKLEQVYQQNRSFQVKPTGGIYSKNGQGGTQAQILQPFPGGANRNTQQLKKAA